MKVDDYKWCAQKHLKACSRMLEHYKNSLSLDNSAPEQEKKEFLLEIYYLLGYVIEGLAVYIVHSMPYCFTNNDQTGAIESHSWKDDSAAKNNEEITDFNFRFTKITGIYFFNEKAARNNKNLSDIIIEKSITWAYQNNSGDQTKEFDFYCNSYHQKKICRDDPFFSKIGTYLTSWNIGNTTDPQIRELYDELQTVIKNAKRGRDKFFESIRYDIMGHHFNRARTTRTNKSKPQPIIGFVEGFILPNLSQATSSNNAGAIPYFGSQTQPDLDPDVKFLIDNWSTDIRYTHNNFGSTADQKIVAKVTLDNLTKFSSTCEKIISMLLPYGL
jgi:hypothetical protein